MVEPSLAGFGSPAGSANKRATGTARADDPARARKFRRERFGRLIEIIGERSTALRRACRCRTQRSQSSQRFGIQNVCGLSWRPSRPLREALGSENFPLPGKHSSHRAAGSKGRADCSASAEGHRSTSSVPSNVRPFRLGIPPKGNGDHVPLTFCILSEVRQITIRPPVPTIEPDSAFPPKSVS